MTKKMEKLFKESKLEITDLLLLAIGFSVEKDGYLINGDTCNRFEFNGRYIRSTLHGNPMIHHGDIEFDIFNVRLMQNLLNFVLNRSTVEDGIYYRLYHEDRKVIDKTNNLTKSNLTIENSNADIITDYYNNDSYKYIEAMFRVANNDQSVEALRRLDYPEFKNIR